MFSRRIRFQLFRVIERDPPRAATSAGGRKQHQSPSSSSTRPQTNIRFGTTGQDSSFPNRSQQHESKFGSNHDNEGQRRFEAAKKGRSYANNHSHEHQNRNQQQESTASMTDANRNRSRFFLSRNDALKEAKADELRAAASGEKRNNILNHSYNNVLLSNSELSPPKRFQALSQVSYDPLLQAGNSRDARRAALRKMKEAALGDRERETESNKNFSSINIARGNSTNPEIDELNQAPNRTAIAEESALAQSLFFRNKISSRRNLTTWDLLDSSASKKGKENSNNSSSNHCESDDLYGTKSSRSPSMSIEEDVAKRSSSREWEKSEGHYKHTFDETTNLEHHRDSVQHSRSIYSQRTLPIPGLYSYHSFITPLEEKQVVAELSKLLLKPTAAYHAAEGRYCINLYEKKLYMNSFTAAAASSSSPTTTTQHSNDFSDDFLGKNERPQRNPLTFSLRQDAPILTSVFERAARLGVIPSMPNVAQVSEMVTPYSGYRPHLKHTSIGEYCGALNLVSNCQMDFVHIDQPWSPKILMVPRAMYVFDQSLLTQFKIGYNRLDFDNSLHQDRSRFTKDYRLEILFATVDAESVPRLSIPVKVSDKIEEKDKAR